MNDGLHRRACALLVAFAVAAPAAGCTGGMIESLFKKKKDSDSVGAAAGLGGAASDPAPPGERITVDRIAAVVNSKVIALSEVRRRAAPIVDARLSAEPDTSRHPELARRTWVDVLDQLISDELLEQEAAKLGLTVPTSELDASIENIRKRSGLSTEAFEDELGKSGFPSIKMYRKAVRAQLLRLKVISLKVRPKIAMGDDVLKAYYERLKTEVESSEEVRLLMASISLPAKSHPAHATRLPARIALAKDIATRLESGEPWADVVASVEPLGVVGTDFGWLKVDDLDARFRIVVTPMKIGEVDIIEAPKQLHVVKVAERKAAGVASFAEVKEEVTARYIEEETARLAAVWLAELRTEALIAIKIEELVPDD